MSYLLLVFGVAVCAVTGALEAGPRKMDMFGVVVVAIVTAVGGGTVRDLILGTKAFWVEDPVWVVVALAAALATFVAARFVRFPEGLLLVLDAFGLAMFTVVGCEKALSVGASYVVVVLMGVITGVAGGMIRDMLCGEIPLVMRSELYATASLVGGVVFIGLYAFSVNESVAGPVAAVSTLIVRLAAIRWRLSLPMFVVRGAAKKS